MNIIMTNSNPGPGDYDDLEDSEYVVSDLIDEDS